MILPDDVIYQIFNHLDVKSLVSFCASSKKQWRNKWFWHHFFANANLPLSCKWKYVCEKYNNHNNLNHNLNLNHNNRSYDTNNSNYENNHTNVFKIIKCYHHISKLEEYCSLIKDIKLLKYATIRICCKIKLHLRLKKYIYLLFPNYDLDLNRLENINFYYNGYIWIFDYEADTTSKGVYVVHVVDMIDAETKMYLFLYKMIKMGLHFDFYY